MIRRSTPPPKYWLFACKSVAGHISYSVVGSIRQYTRGTSGRSALNDENALLPLSVKPFLHQHASDSSFKTVENSIQLTMWFMLDFFFKGKKDSKLLFHCITPTQFSNSFFGFLDRKPKKVEKEKNVYLEMMIYIPALLQNSSITWGVSEMGTHMCCYNSPWCCRPFCLLRNSSNFRWWGWYVMHSSLEFLFRNFFWDILN